MLESVSYDIASGFGSRVIKRYSNRKLYDTRSSRYVTLLQIAQMVRSGEEVQIIDNRTKEDKTEVTLALIISEELKNSPGGIPLTTLRALIRHDSTPPPSGEQPTFAGARLLGLLGVSEVNVRRGYAAAEDRSAHERESFVGVSEETHTEQESSMNDPLKQRPEGGRTGLDASRLDGPRLEAVRGDGQRQAERSLLVPGMGDPAIERQIERLQMERVEVEQRLEQWRAEIEARVSVLMTGLPGTQAVTDLQGQVQRLDQRVAELEQRLSGPGLLRPEE